MPRGTDAGLNRTISREEAQALLDSCDSDRDRALLLVLERTGCRISEAIQLRANDLRFSDQAIQLQNLKRRGGVYEEKDVAVHREVLDRLRSYCQRNNIGSGSYLFPGRVFGTHISVRQARNIVYAAGRRAGVFLAHPRDAVIRPLWPHSLRHTYCTELLKAGVDVFTVADQLGHSNLESTKRYRKFVIADRVKAIEAVAL